MRSLLGVGCLFSTVATHVAFVRVSGVYDLTMFDTFLTLHHRCEESGGYSLDNYSYKISYSSLSRLFVLPHDDNDSDTLSIVISMKDPTQGGKMQFLIAQFPMQEDERTLSLNISEELLQNKYGGKLRREMTGPTWEIIYKVLRALSGKRGSVPKSFRSARGLHCVSCSVGDNAGKLYVLDTSFLFLNKQAIHLRFHGTAKVQVCPIQPQGAARRKEETWSRFNVTVTMQNGSQHTFKSLEKRELEPIVKFLQERGVGFQRQTARKQQQQQEEEQQLDRRRHCHSGCAAVTSPCLHYPTAASVMGSSVSRSPTQLHLVGHIARVLCQQSGKVTLTTLRRWKPWCRGPSPHPPPHPPGQPSAPVPAPLLAPYPAPERGRRGGLPLPPAASHPHA